MSELASVGRAVASHEVLRHVAGLIRRDIRSGHRPALIGVSYCGKCGNVGTIVDLRKCCIVAAFVALGGLWDIDPPKWRTAKTPRRYA